MLPHRRQEFRSIDARCHGGYREVVITGSRTYATGSLRYRGEPDLRVGGDNRSDNGVVVDHIRHLQRRYGLAPDDECR